MRKIEDVTLKDGRSLKEVLESHKKWLENEESGDRADLSDEDLSDVDLSNLNLAYVILEGAFLTDAILTRTHLRGADLKGVDLTDVNLTDANLSYANLKGAYLSYANLKGAYLSYANLEDANLEDANLSCANLTWVNLKGANLRGADLTNANLVDANLVDTNLKDVKYNNSTSFFTLQCPEEGSFIGYKKADNKIVKLLITEDAKRSSATSRKCRCSKAKVLSITSLDGKENFEKVASDHDSNFIYEVGKIVEVEKFADNRWKECSTGIHFFITRNEAVMY